MLQGELSGSKSQAFDCLHDWGSLGSQFKIELFVGSKTRCKLREGCAAVDMAV